MTPDTQNLIPIGQVAREHGITRTAYRSAMNAGLIAPADRGGRGYRGGFRITRDDALLLITAAKISALVGITLCIALRMIIDSGGRIAPDGTAVIIPIPTPAARAA